MKLVTFGDSWVWGDELGDKILDENGNLVFNHNYNQYIHSNNIGGLVKSKYNFDKYENFAINGGSNTHILFQLTNYINSDSYNETDIILIGMTSPLRQYLHCNLTNQHIGSWPFWDLEQFLECSDSRYKNSDDFKEWWRINTNMFLNGHNDVMEYSKICLSLKALLKDHKKYIVWQSIDSKFWNLFENETNFDPVLFKKYTESGEESISRNFPLTKDKLNSLLKKETLDSQLWINIDEPCWMEWLIENYETNDVFIESGTHPNELGIKLWYEKILKKYLEKVLDN